MQTKIRKNPEKSLMYEIDSQYRTALDLSDIPPMTMRHKLVLLTFHSWNRIDGVGGFVTRGVLSLQKWERCL